MKKNNKQLFIFLSLLIILLVSAFFSAFYGAVNISPGEMLSSIDKYFGSAQAMELNERIFMDIRLPRTILCMVVGASLAAGGTLVQALFRNPIVEPGLIGTSSGAAFGASLYFVLGSSFSFNSGEWTLPLSACAGAVISTILVLIISRSNHSGKTSIVALLLTGIAINALLLSGVGFLSYLARDPQARSITFWGMGTLSGANWHSTGIVGATSFICILSSLFYSKHLNALMMGEDEAFNLGINIKKLKLVILSINVVMVAVATAFVGVISFVGLMIPHLLRMAGGSDNRFLIPNSALAGGILLTLADMVARLSFPPAELPIGIVTSIIGVPVFIILLRRKNYFF